MLVVGGHSVAVSMGRVFDSIVSGKFIPSKGKPPFYYSNHMNLENQLNEDGFDVDNPKRMLKKSNVHRYDTVSKVPNCK